MAWRWFNEQEDPLIKGLAPALVDLLDKGRERAGVPFYLTSGLRSPEANAQAGGVADSAHVAGLAADLRVDTPYQLFKMIDGLLDAGARRLIIGIQIKGGRVDYFNLHVDIDLSKPSPVLSVKVYP